METLRLKLSFVVIAFSLSLGMVACGGGTSTTTTTPPPKLGSMAGTWDLTATGGNGNPIAVEAVLAQDGSGNISGSGTVTATGPSGNMFEADIFGASLSSAADVAIDYLGNTCGTDSGNRGLSGTIDASNKVTLTYSVGGSLTVVITGTLNSSATPPFSGSLTISAPGCKSDGQTGSVTGVLAGSLSGTYSGASAADNTETITLTLTDTSGTLSGNGSDTKTGNFTISGATVGNAFSATLVPPPSDGGSVFGYFDPQLGAKGSILLTSFQGGTATSCSSGVPIDNGSCLIAILAKQ
jgi:hypothetical protein